MSVCKMNLISIMGSLKKLDELVNICGETQIFHPDNVSSFYSNTQIFSAVSEENPYSNPLAKLKNNIYACNGKIYDINIDDFHVSRSKIDKYVNFFSTEVERIVDEKRELFNKITELKNEIEILKHFYKLDKSTEEILNCEFIKARFGKIPIENFKSFEETSEKVNESGLEFVFFELDSDSEYKWGLYFTSIDDITEIDIIFSKMQFREIKLKKYSHTPLVMSNLMEKEISKINHDIKVLENNLLKFWKSQEEFCIKYYNKIKKLNTYFEIKSYAVKYNDKFVLLGWIPENEKNILTDKISKIPELEYSLEEASKLLDNSPPVKLSNNKLFKPFEFFVNTYGMPCYNEIDPTIFVAITYSLLFGIMFADLGQGLLLALGGYFVSKYKKMEFGKILIPCGISSAIFGTLYGSVFGFENALDSFYRNVFGLHEKPIEVMKPSFSDTIIYTAVGIGIVILILSMMLGVYSAIKRNHVGEAIFGANGICGLIFYISAIFYLIDSLVLNTNISKNYLFIIVFLILPLLLIMFKEVLIKILEKESNWQPESWTDYISQSFFELFEILLSYVTNTMSFLRVGAFVLVHAGMMMVVFTIAEMVGGVGYVIVVVFGNIFVIALEALLSGIQVLRLEFYEMFSKFFEGQGKEFSPVVIEKSTN